MSSSIDAVIFDFNGTLFFDTPFHNKAWSIFVSKYNLIITPDDLFRNIHGHTNKEILYSLFQYELSNDLIEKYYEEKEDIYRTICYDNIEICQLSPGSELFLDFLHDRNIKKTIATASYPKNVAFYNSLFNLERWFDVDDIIHDNGNYRGKPSPDMFIAAAEIIDVPINKCMIIEDSLMGLAAAKNANAGKIIAISHEDDISKFSQIDFIDQIITGFHQIDRKYFN